MWKYASLLLHFEKKEEESLQFQSASEEPDNNLLRYTSSFAPLLSIDDERKAIQISWKEYLSEIGKIPYVGERVNYPLGT